MKFASVLAVVVTGVCLLSPTFLPAESIAPVEQVEEVATPVEITAINHSKISENQENITFQMDGSIEVRMFALGGDNPRLVIDFPNAVYRKKNVITPAEGELAVNIRIGLHTEPKRKTRVVVDLSKDFAVDYKHTLKESENLLEIVLTKEGVPAIAAKPAEEVKPVVEPVVVAKIEEPTPVPPVKKTQPVVAPVQKEVKTDTEDTKKKLEALPLDKKPIPPVFATKDVQPEEVIAAGEVAADVPQLLEVSFDDSSDRGEMVLFHLNDFFPPTVSAIEKNNPRVLCEFPNMNLSADVQRDIQAKGKYVEAIRTAVHKDKGTVRVVLDLSPDRDYDLQQVFFKNDNLFVLIVNELHEKNGVK